MKKNYRMLIGCQFAVGDDVYTVCDIVRVDNRTLAEAVASRPAPGGRESVRLPVEKVVAGLLVDEEIELYSPNFLGLPGRA
jgi:hypothetical protein